MLRSVPPLDRAKISVMQAAASCKIYNTSRQNELQSETSPLIRNRHLTVKDGFLEDGTQTTFNFNDSRILGAQGTKASGDSVLEKK